MSLARSTEESPFVKGLQQEASQAKMPINVGIHEPATGGKRVKNTLIWIDEGGMVTQRYQKLHLFDVEIKGGPMRKAIFGVTSSCLRQLSKSRDLLQEQLTLHISQTNYYSKLNPQMGMLTPEGASPRK